MPTCRWGEGLFYSLWGIPLQESSHLITHCLISLFQYQWSPTFLAPGTDFVEDNFSTGQRGGDCFRMIQVHYTQAHLLLGGLVPNRPGPVLVHGPEVGDPCPTGPKLGGESNLTMYLKHVEKCVTKEKIESRGLIIEGKMDCVTKRLFSKRILIYTSEKEYLMKLRGTKIE